MVSCSLINNLSFSYEDTCNFTCNTGYKLTGSNTRSCQSDGSWSGTDTVCTRGNDDVRKSYLLICQWVAKSLAATYVAI